MKESPMKPFTSPMNERQSLSAGCSSSVSGLQRHTSGRSSGPLSNSSIAAAQSLNTVLHQPSNAAEWQLFLVLHRANLIQYYDTFISQGGDDVQQLLEAGEEEFLEIMALVGMAAKPLHVRRLQKALQEYSINPTAFQLVAIQKAGSLPVNSSPIGIGDLPIAHTSTALLAADPMIAGILHSSPQRPNSVHMPPVTQRLQASNSAIVGNQASAINIVSPESPGTNSLQSNGSSNIWPSPKADAYDSGLTDTGGLAGAVTLNDAQIQRLIECSVEILRQNPDIEKGTLGKKGISRDIAAILEMPIGSPYRIEEIRRCAAIYGRGDMKRKRDKFTLHELLINEAAARLCLHRPILLSQRDELFRLARLVVKQAGFNLHKHNGQSKFGQEEMYTEKACMSTYKRPSHSDGVVGNSDDADGSGSPAPSTSSASQSSPGTSTLAISLSPPTALPVSCRDGHSESTFCSPGSMSSVYKRSKRRLDEIGVELQRVSAEQEAVKRRVNEAQEMGDLISIQNELKRLTQRQMELSDEEASLRATSDGSAGARKPIQLKGTNGSKYRIQFVATEEQLKKNDHAIESRIHHNA